MSDKKEPVGAPNQSDVSDKSVKSIFSSVERRHDGLFDGSTGNLKQHLNVSTTADAIAQDDRTNIGSSTISRLDELEQKKNKESALAKKTKDLLMKGKATGDNGIAQEDRIYVIVSFVDDAAARKCVFFNKKTTSFGDFAENIGKKFPFPAFKKAMRPAGMSLEVRLKDDYMCDDSDGEAEKEKRKREDKDRASVVTPHGIDRGRLLVDALDDMSELEVAAASSAELAEAQTRVEGYVAELRQQREREQQEREQAARKKEEEEEERKAMVDPAQVQPGDTYIYTKEAGIGSKELVKVVTVHQDDFPNLYFTIQFLSDLDRQKQTTATWLKLVAVPGPKEGGGFSITVTHGLQSYSVGGLSPDMSVAALKVLVQEASGVAPKKQKLICRGGILKDTDALSQTKVVKNSKVSLMGKK